ncbi:CHAP domain-containing protein [Nonomuraea sp. NPDC048901]|uniref:CHAP domain-containing protein n=1 Tax=Nonomuraea sp. NPDC048901 TaxID=3155627 RepID=UPI0033CBFD67
MTAAAMLAEARDDLGLTGRPNRITRDYASRNGAAFLAAPWCQMSITWWARRSGNADAVLPRGDRAYTVYSAEDGERLGRWHAGTIANIKKYAEPGAVVYFDWQYTDRIASIDHVGVIERVLPDGRVQTIEGNTGDTCKRRVRSSDVIAGFWAPAYAGAEPAGRPKPAKPKKNWTEGLVDTLPLLKVGAKGTGVKRAFYLLESHGFGLDPDVYDDMTFTPAMGSKVAAFQQAKKLKVDKEIGPATWTALVEP